MRVQIDRTNTLCELESSEEEKAKYAEENRQGWNIELDELREYVAKQVHASARR